MKNQEKTVSAVLMLRLRARLRRCACNTSEIFGSSQSNIFRTRFELLQSTVLG